MNVPKDYETRFEKAEQTFLYQIVFDPNTNKLVPLNPLPDDIDPAYLHFAGQYPFLLHHNFLLFQIRTVSWPA
jgi:exonuclease-1